MKIRFAGTGTSHGVPVIGCTCRVCTSKDPKDKRGRASLFIRSADGTSIVIDTGPDFRTQALRAKLCKLDAVLLTHSHADHLHGIDDLRIFSHTKPQSQKTEQALKIYAGKETLDDIRERFNYIFLPTQEGGGKPHLELVDTAPFTADSPLCIGSLEIIPVPLMHGRLKVCGWKITDTDVAGKRTSCAYLTDCSFISKASIALVHGSDHLIIDALRERRHSTHLNFSQSIAYAKKIEAKHTWFTHICHDFTHSDIKRFIAAHTDGTLSIEPAYDNMIL